MKRHYQIYSSTDFENNKKKENSVIYKETKRNKLHGVKQ